MENQHGSRQRQQILDEKIHGKGIRELIYSDDCTPERLRDLYDSIADDYDEYSKLNGREAGCRALISAFAEWVPDKDARILDCGAGTGFAGVTLKQLGYHKADGFEPSKDMLDIAESNNIYQHYYVGALDPEKPQSEIADETYDGVVMMGVFGPGHVGYDCLPELIRMTKKGGVIAFNMPDKCMTGEFESNLIDSHLQHLVKNGMLAKWDVLRGTYRWNEECNIYRMITGSDHINNNSV